MIDRAGRYANTEDFDPIRSLIAEYVDAEPSEPKTTNQPEHVRWLARSEVLSWVPTIEALTDADALRQKAIADAEVARATSKGQVGTAAEVRHRREYRQNKAHVDALRISR